MATFYPVDSLTHEQELKLLESCEVDPKWMKEAVKTVVKWCSMQEHLQEAANYLVNTRLVERLLLLSRGSVEECKMRLDRLLKARSLAPDVCQNRTLEEFDKIRKYVHVVQVKKITPKLERVLITQFKPVDNYNDFDVLTMFRLNILIVEHRFCNDIVVSERLVFDYKNVKIGLLTKINPIVLVKIERFLTEGHGMRIKSISILNAPAFIDKFVALFKQFLKPKIAERICIYKSNEDLYKDIPREILPADYGGDEKSCADLFDQWIAAMQTQEEEEKLKNLDMIMSNESRRLKDCPQDFGTSGNFRMLEVD